MDKRIMTRTGAEVSRLGMGNMRLPVRDGQIDYPLAEALIDRLMEAGVTYYDTAYFYHDGKSEDFTRRALIERYPRSRFTVATKLPVNQIKDAAQADEILKTQYDRLGVDRIDFHLLHGIGLKGWQHAREIGADRLQHAMKADGRCLHIGFSFHGPADELPPILEQNDWDFVQLQINYYDWLAGDAEKLYDAARRRGLAVIVMEPVRGGGLAKCPPSVQRIFTDLDPSRSVASWALRWVADLPGVDVILSGMSDLEQVEDNIRTFSPALPISADERPLFDAAMAEFRKLPLIPCTNCKYCKDCPQEIDISRIFSGYNDHIRFGSSWYLQNYKSGVPEEKKASACVSCGACEKICPQRIPVIRDLKGAHELAMRYPS